MNLFKIVNLLLILSLSACSTAYYGALDSIGIPKRDIMVHRVKAANETQHETKEQIQTTLEQFTALTHFDGGDLEKNYKKLNASYKDSEAQAKEIRKRIEDIEDVSEALFSEWEAELESYSNASLKRNSAKQLADTRRQYKQLIRAMIKAESKIEPVLSIFRDQVLYLKHNLNAQAISSLKGELNDINNDVQILVAEMEKSINEADAFIQSIEK